MLPGHEAFHRAVLLYFVVLSKHWYDRWHVPLDCVDNLVILETVGMLNTELSFSLKTFLG